MRRRYLSVTIDRLTERDNFHEALGFGMNNTAIFPFCVLDQQTGECITRFYSHRRKELDVKQTLPEGDTMRLIIENACKEFGVEVKNVKQPLPEGDTMRLIIENACKECGVEVKFVEHFSDEPKLLPLSQYSQYEWIMDDFDDM